ncbi:MAG: MOSC domain-containing protein [Alphaproteobacteria bacterium]|nr:MOSC domain-containing protein [Alphaproteobacteria bacterium]
MHGALIGIAWRPKPRQKMTTAEEVMVSAEAGLAGDYRGAPGKRQATLLFEEDWLTACALLGETRAWTIRRANFLVRGIPNPKSAGGLLWIGPVLVEITGETEPCNRMDAQWPGLRAALTPDWRGGVTARVLEGGMVSLGAEVRAA